MKKKIVYLGKKKNKNAKSKSFFSAIGNEGHDTIKYNNQNHQSCRRRSRRR